MTMSEELVEQGKLSAIDIDKLSLSYNQKQTLKSRVLELEEPELPE